MNLFKRKQAIGVIEPVNLTVLYVLICLWVVSGLVWAVTTSLVIIQSARPHLIVILPYLH